MKQITQTQGGGHIIVHDVPPPALHAAGVLVRTAVSLISAGTERAKVELAQQSLVGKARARPEQVQQVLQALRDDGVERTLRKVRNRLDSLQPLGYSCAGTVIAVGQGAEEFIVGDRVACAGAGHANHAEVNFVPKNLCVKVPAPVEFEAAAFATVGAIALQGVRQADVHLGEIVVVVGLGLVGQLTVQLLRAAGCVVMGMDLNPARCDLALRMGAIATATDKSRCASTCAQLSGGHGADAVLVTAASSGNEPILLASALCREKGRVVVVGDVRMELPRAPFYNKELDLRLSRSYGPGRYDPQYEEKGVDYPYGYVRWTERRNMAAFLGLVAQGQVQISPLVTHRFPIEDAGQAYALISGKTREPFLGVVIEYPRTADGSAQWANTVTVRDAVAPPPSRATGHRPVVAIGLIGAGNFAQDTLIPALKSTKAARLRSVVTASGLTARSVAERFGFERCASDPAEVFDDPAISAVVVATRHDSHAALAARALRAGKSVFVEKPLALDDRQLRQVVEAHGEARCRAPRPVLAVGFNRRFAPLSIALKQFFAQSTSPLMINYRVNAGFIPRDHWTHDPSLGGGRILGEVCHFADWIQFLVAAPPVQVFARCLPDNGKYNRDNVSATIEYADGSIANLVYFANGDKAMGKERAEVSCDGQMATLDDFRLLKLARNGHIATRRRWLGMDKGHAAEMLAFVRAVAAGGPDPIPLSELIATSRVTFAILASLREDRPVRIAEPTGEARVDD